MTKRTPRQGWVDWLYRLARLFGMGSHTGKRDDQEALYREVEEVILGGPRRYTRAQLVAGTGMSVELAARLWRSLGFAEVDDDEGVFTDGDREALLELDQLRSAGLVSEDVEEAMSRSVGQAMAGLADWQVELLYQLIDYPGGGLSRQQVLDIGNRVLPLLEQMQNYVWRRHLAAAVGRVLASMPGESETKTLTIGFADLVGFTRITRRLSPAELSELIEQFQRVATEVVANCHGRVVKTVGDDILFVAERPSDGAEIALELLERLAVDTDLPGVRVGLAVGPVVTRFGDVYGEAVNIAARLTAHAQPGTVLADRNLANSLEHDDRFQLRELRPLAVRGYRHLPTWSLSRAGQQPARSQRAG